jgi:superfamily II DNA or RNA helicase
VAGDLGRGVYEALITAALEARIEELKEARLDAQVGDLANAEAPDRLSRHVGDVVRRALESLPEESRAEVGAVLVRRLLEELAGTTDAVVPAEDLPLSPARVLGAVLARLPDGSNEVLQPPLTPLLDTTLLTNSPGEPAVGHELRAEIGSADSIDAVVAFVRLSGIKPLMEELRRHCQAGRSLRVLTTTYTNSTELAALEELERLGAGVRVSYDTTGTRLHAKAWVFHRTSGYSTAYIGSSNLTHMAQVTGAEWNVRVSGARNPDVVEKMNAVFSAYWEGGDFLPFDREEFQARTATVEQETRLPPVEIQLRPFQDRLLEEVAVSREAGHHSNLLVAATGTGKTVMAAVDYARLRRKLPRNRLLFVAHREEILDQSRDTFRLALRDSTFGEKWVGGVRPTRFDHVFASIQSLRRSVNEIDPDHFDVVIVDEFHHAAADSYTALLERLRPRELLGLTATPERADGLDVLKYFDGRIAAELRVWDAIDQQYLAPFLYFGIHDGLDLREVPWRRGVGYDINELTNVMTSDHAWARRVVAQVIDHVDVGRMRALGFCVSISHARFMATQFSSAGIPAVAVWGDSPPEERSAALRDLGEGRVKVVFSVDLFSEGIDVPSVDTLLLLRPTDSATLFLQQLGRGLRRTDDKDVCTVLDFVGQHRKEFRFDRRFRALLGGSRIDVERQIRDDFPFLPSGCDIELDPVARQIVLDSIRNAIPSEWRAKCRELQSLGDVTLREYLAGTGLELEDVYAANHSWSEMRREVGYPTEPPRPDERPLLRAVGRLLHVDDRPRLDAYRSFVEAGAPPDPNTLSEIARRFTRMLVASITTLRTKDSLEDGIVQLWQHPQTLAELRELLELLPERVDHVHEPLGLDANVPLRVHARYSRVEILSAFGIGPGVKPPNWQAGVWWDAESRTDLFAFTLDKSSGSFSPTTRYRDYAISRDLIHWESQSATSVASPTGQRYLNHEQQGSSVVLFARLRADDRALWCLGPATYVRHEGDRPIAITWRLQHSLPGDLYAEFAAAVA